MKALGVVGILLVTLIVALGLIYNNMVNLEENVNGGWSEVQNQLKRSNELLPNLVKTVQAYAGHESGVFKDVAESRAKVSQAVNLDVSKLANDPALQKQLLDAQASLKGSMSRLIAVAENYPQLKANENYLKLQDEIAGTINRVSVARGRAIGFTREFNKGIRRVPNIFVAGTFGFVAKKYYEASEDEQKVPVLNFGQEKK